ncbi:uncharacterized protein EI97DRAFT_376613 [Westerdykella ornata]|uniref:Uncharacterized protein n=1 Tax=Westerdykella ornata TaxID=318751 RepID=A0A6A6JP56_WESOR|nr:uncharacterized protein EI97DRAFT_376613 [Westerdykella ornata]KAF2276729.1 hypothetical protein EI97DRAFT_376613 [Westerdykella ornata]
MTSSAASEFDASRSMTTSYTTSPTKNVTTSSTASRTTPGSSPPLFPPAGDISSTIDPEKARKESVFNYYFLILAAFGVLVAVGLWWIRRRRLRRKEEMRLSGQDALARDLDGWVTTRRWLHGAWRYNQTTTFVRREEGLNEHGEAPPPYQPSDEVPVTQGDTRSAQAQASGLAIPLRALSREDLDAMRPPKYEEEEPRERAFHGRFSTRRSHRTRSGTSYTNTNASTRDFLAEETVRPNG